MDLNRIATFVRVVEKESFTAAAAALGVPKSSVSRSVARLEEELGVQLLQRTTRKLSLTDAGRDYFQRARLALDGLDEANAAVSESGANPHGVVRVTAPVDVGVLMLADIVAAFVRKHPGIRIDLSLSSRVENLVDDGFDLAVRAGRLVDSSLIARKVGAADMALFASPAYLKRRGRPKKLADLAAHDCVIFRPSEGSAKWRLTGPGGDTTVDVNGVVSVDDMMFMQRAVVAGIGIGAIPRLPIQCKKEDLVRVLPEYTITGAALHAVWPASRHVPARVALFRDFVIASFAAMRWDDH